MPETANAKVVQFPQRGGPGGNGPDNLKVLINFLNDQGLAEEKIAAAAEFFGNDLPATLDIPYLHLRPNARSSLIRLEVEASDLDALMELIFNYLLALGFSFVRHESKEIGGHDDVVLQDSASKDEWVRVNSKLAEVGGFNIEFVRGYHYWNSSSKRFKELWDTFDRGIVSGDRLANQLEVACDLAGIDISRRQEFIARTVALANGFRVASGKKPLQQSQYPLPPLESFEAASSENNNDLEPTKIPAATPVRRAWADHREGEDAISFLQTEWSPLGGVVYLEDIMREDPRLILAVQDRCKNLNRELKAGQPRWSAAKILPPRGPAPPIFEARRKADRERKARKPAP